MKTRYYYLLSPWLFVGMLALFTLLFASLPASAATHTPVTTAATIAQVDAYIQAAMRENRIPGAGVGLVHDNQIVHVQGFGIADATQRAVTARTPFIIGSVSKSFTALAIMQLVQQGKIELDAPVQRYIPWFHLADSNASAQITVRDLLNQTSGIPASAGAPTILGIATLLVYQEQLEPYVRSLSSVKLDRPVGTTFEYANANYNILGLLIEKASGQSYESYVQQHIFTPLHMDHSFTSIDAAKKQQLAQSYRWLFGFPAAYEPHITRAMLPAGFIASNVEDMSHYLIAQMNVGQYDGNSILSPQGIATLHAPTVAVKGLEPGTGYGMGWFAGPTAGVPTLWHNGEAGGYYTYMVIEPQSHWGAILLFNIAGLLAGGVYSELQAGIVHLLAGDAVPAAQQSMSRFYLITNIMLGLILALLLWPLVSLPRWYKKLGQNPRWRVMRIILPLLRELLVPLVLLLGLPMLVGASWSLTLLVFPDLALWLLVVLVGLLATGIIRAWLVWRFLRRNSVPTPATSVDASSPSASVV